MTSLQGLKQDAIRGNDVDSKSNCYPVQQEDSLQLSFPAVRRKELMEAEIARSELWTSPITPTNSKADDEFYRGYQLTCHYTQQR